MFSFGDGRVPMICGAIMDCDAERHILVKLIAITVNETT